jgi:DNA-binding MarR family transcriptional regulator
MHRPDVLRDIEKSDPNDERVRLLEIAPKVTRTLKHIEQEKKEWLERMLENWSRNIQGAF